MPDVDISQFFFLLVGGDGTEGEGVDIGVSPLEGGCCISKKRDSGKENAAKMPARIPEQIRKGVFCRMLMVGRIG